MSSYEHLYRQTAVVICGNTGPQKGCSPAFQAPKMSVKLLLCDTERCLIPACEIEYCVRHGSIIIVNKKENSFKPEEVCYATYIWNQINNKA